MLEEVERRVQHRTDVNVDTGLYYQSIQQMVNDAAELGCDAVINCTGLGSSKLCNDDNLVGARGILLHYDRQSCIRRDEINEHREHGQMVHDACVLTEDQPWGSESHPCYMIARGDTIVVGGSYLEGDPGVSIRPEERAKLLNNARWLGIDTNITQPSGEWVGYRPYRPISRLEEDPEHGQSEGVRVIHSYGYGGSGWTVFTGVAREAAELVLR